MPLDWWPTATRRPVPNTASPHPGEGGYLYEVAGAFTEPRLGWALHVVVGNGSPFETFRQAVSPKRRFSHVWIAKNGDVEQYGPLSHKSWANGTGNGLYYSAETEGVPEEPLTTAQITRLAEFHVFLGVQDRIAVDGPGDRGIICHYQGGADWGGHTCPDPAPGGQGPRSHQRWAILHEVARLREPAADPIHGPLKLGSTGRDVLRVQHRLNQAGSGLAEDGDYGVKTQQAVVIWQGHHFLVRDGVTGPATTRSLGFAYVAAGK